jgi:threonine dehydratase
LDTNDDIIHFEYTKKANRINCSAVVWIELKKTTDFESVTPRMIDLNFYRDVLNL